MRFYLITVSPSLSNGETHISTTYHILNKDGTLLKEYKDITGNGKTFLPIDEPILKEGIEYLISSQFLLSTGYTQFSKPELYVDNSYKTGEALGEDIPSLIAVPNLIFPYDVFNFPTSGITIGIDNFETMGTAKIKDITYSIENVDGKLVFCNKYTNLPDKPKLLNVNLNRNSQYKLLVNVSATNKDSSYNGGVMISTLRGKDIKLKTNLLTLDFTIDNLIEIYDIVGLNSLSWKIFNTKEMISSGNELDSNFILKSSDIIIDGMYSIEITIEAYGRIYGTSYFTILRENGNSTYLPADLPLQL